MVKFAIQQLINENKESLGFSKTRKNVVVFGSSSVKFTESMIPCVVVDQLNSVALDVHCTDILSIKLFFMITSDLQQYELMFEKLKQLFYKKAVIEYQYSGETYTNIVEYQNGSDYYDGATGLINGKQYKFLQFVVTAPKINM